jgi:hypothetical protein
VKAKECETASSDTVESVGRQIKHVELSKNPKKIPLKKIFGFSSLSFFSFYFLISVFTPIFLSTSSSPPSRHPLPLKKKISRTYYLADLVKFSNLSHYYKREIKMTCTKSVLTERLAFVQLRTARLTFYWYL